MEQHTTDQSDRDDGLTALVSIVDRFEDAWQRGLSPEIEPYLPAAGSPHWRRVLVELIRIDLEYHLKAERDARVKNYLGRYPNLAPTELDGSTSADREYFRTQAGSVEGITDPEGGGSPEFVAGTNVYPPQTQADSRPALGRVFASAGAELADGRSRYVLIRMHAEGGIGQVWIARDRDLDREVALKRLQPAGAESAAAQSRFLREARVTGQLQHPGIVPVYELCQTREWADPFYTMRLIKGRTLTQAIQTYHKNRKEGRAGRLDLRELIGAYLSVCQTVAYAHSRGVIHRDIKGDNVVLGDFGEVMVVDWGLAKVIGEPEPQPSRDREAAGQPMGCPGDGARDDTVEGSILGTPSYMSPEQAAGQTELIEPRSDVYGLGAVLYEILTGEPPFRGNVQDVLRRVIEETPVSPRRRVADVSPALEGICLKCLAKAPGDRYASATELARDLQRYLADEPVSAFAEPWTFKVRRWVGRHRTFATATAAGLLVATASLTVTTIFLERANEREALARTKAEVNFQLASQAVDRFFTKVSDNPRLKAYGLETLRRDLLLEAREFFDRLARERGGEPRVEVDRARNFLRLAKITEELGEPGEATSSSLQARSIFTELTQRNPRRPEYREGLAMAFDSLGRSYGGDLQLDKAKTAFQDATSVWEQLVRDNPNEPRYRYRNAVTLNQLGRLLCIKLRDVTEGEKVLNASLSLCRRLVDDDPDRLEYRNQLAEALLTIGVAWSDREFDRVKGLLDQALEIREKLVVDHPDVSEYQADLVEACVLIATSYSNARIPGRVQTIYQRIRQISDDLARQHPDVPVFVENRHLIEMLSSVPVLSISGDHAHVTAAAEAAVAGAPRSGIVMLYAACCYSLASESALSDQHLPAAERGQRAEDYQIRAMELLRAARAKNLFDQPWYRSGLKTDPDLKPMRGRAEFREFVRELDAQAARPRLSHRGGVRAPDDTLAGSE
jgi:tetratricopeptide (TPR) repeat protein